MILETKRLVLRRLDASDFENLASILKDPQTMYAYEHGFSDEEVQEWLDRQLARYAQYGFGLWAVIEKASGRFVGQCGVTMQDWSGREVPEIGYLFRRDCWGRGFATEAAVGCRDYAFRTLGLPEVFSIIRDNNYASQRVAVRNGMAVRGSFVKHYYNVDMPHLVFSVKKEVCS